MASSPSSISQSRTDSRAVKSSGPSRTSCEICRKRKIRCTGERPACARCIRLEQVCSYQSTTNVWTYIAELEEKIKYMEGRAVEESAAVQQKRRKQTSVSVDDLPDVPPLSPVSTSPLTIPGGPQGIPSMSSDAQLVAQLPLAYDLVGEISRHDGKTPVGSEATYISAGSMPPPHITNQLMNHYRTCTGGSYPIFHIPTLLQQIDMLSSSQGPFSPSDVCTVMSVLAVATTTLKRNSPLFYEWKPKAHVYWDSAKMHFRAALEQPGLKRLQVLLIHLQYILFNPKVGSVWDLSGSVMRAAVDLCLHIERTQHPFEVVQSPLEEDMRRRLFWICYSVDRNVCTALGRPPAIPDSWISAKFPSLMDDSLITAEGILLGDPSPLKATSIHRFKLRILQSEIHERLYLPHPTPPPPQWFQSVLDRLKEWQVTLPSGTEFCTTEWWTTKYHLTLIYLYRPSPGNPSPDAQALTKALDSARIVMRAYQEMHRKCSINCNWLTTYQLFVSGVTTLNSLWQASITGRVIVSNHVEVLVEVQASMSVMEALAAFTPGTMGIRNAYEAVVGRITRLLISKSQTTTRPYEPLPAAQSTPESLPSWNTWTSGDFGILLDQVGPANPLDLSDVFQQTISDVPGTGDWDQVFGQSNYDWNET